MEQNKEISKIIKEVTRDDAAEIIGLDDTFKFKCQQCGQCCMNRNDIIVNPFDVYNGAKYLGITPEEFVDKYLDVTLGAHSKIPMLLLSSDNETGYCPFLKLDIKSGCKFKCTIHAAKPGACANHPIGVVASCDLKEKINGGNHDLNFIKVSQCENSKCDNDVLVRDWVHVYLDNIDEINIAHELQTYITEFFMPSEYFKLCKYILDLEHDYLKNQLGNFIMVLKDSMKTICENTIGYAYMNYDINKPFLEQAQQNKETLKEFYVLMKELYHVLLDTFNIQEGHVDEFIEKCNNMLYNNNNKDTQNEGEDINGNN